VTIRPDIAGLPDTVPARMVNEYVYCPRLFYLEWVQGQFATSDDVEEGLYVHRVVDQPGGDLPDPSADDPERFAGRTARSVWLTSTELGVSAKLDLAEVTSTGKVVPVDYKKGKPDHRGRPWPSDEIQSTLQALLLREAGHEVDSAEIWYAETRQRVAIDIDTAREAHARQVLTGLWQTAAADAAPPPLTDDRKCVGCSLVGICLPDETNALLARGDDTAPRRLTVRDPDSKPVYVQEQGAVVSVRRGRMEIHKEGTALASYRLIDVQQLSLLGNVTVTAQAMRELFARETPVCWFSYGGWFTGLTQGLPSGNVDLRRRQYTASPEEALAVAASIVEGKIRNSRILMRRNIRTNAGTVLDQLRDLAAAARRATSAPSLLGIEGTAARLYFGRFTEMLTEGAAIDSASFDANGRARRPPPDPINALLSFLYALLVKDITATVNAVGLDPFYGVYHRPRYRRPALALDLAEEFRPLIADSTVVQLVNNGEIRPAHFIRRAGACQLDRDGRRVVISAYERRMSHEIKHPVFGYRVSYRRALDVQARILGAHLLGETPAYTPFTTR
jgi:CRISP-associated protein Cas1